MRCQETTRKGLPCTRAALVDKTVCASHDGRCGGQEGNRNALRHGLYSKLLSPEEQFDLVTGSLAEGLDEEIGMTRVLIVRALRARNTPPETYTRLLESLCRQLRLRRILSGQSSDSIGEGLGRVLVEFANEVGLEPCHAE
jgi:hypothetical protein